jgi:hypothetical protein
MTSVVIKYPIKNLSKRIRKELLYKDFRNKGHLKGRTIRLRYMYGSKSAAATLVDNGAAILFRMSLFRAISGQNAFTLPGLKTAARLAFKALKKSISKEFGGDPFELDRSRDIEPQFVDLVRHFRVGTCSDVSCFLDALYRLLDRNGSWEHLARYKGHHSVGTVEVGMGDLGLTVKFYNKYLELQQPGRQLPYCLPDRELLLESMKGSIRMEVSLDHSALKERGLTKLANWKSGTRDKIFSEVIDGLKLKGRFKSQGNQDVFQSLESALRLTFLRWQAGHDLNDMSKSTRARHRKDLREKHGIDIDANPVFSAASYVPIKDVLCDDRIVRPCKADIEKWIPAWPTGKYS